MFDIKGRDEDLSIPRKEGKGLSACRSEDDRSLKCVLVIGRENTLTSQHDKSVDFVIHW